MARQHFANEIGTNEMFTGNGLTKVNKDLNCMPPGKQYGALETLTFEKNPPTVGQKRAYGGLRSLTLK